MKLAIVTNKQLHHKYFVAELYKRFNVEVIIHPTGKSEGKIQTLKSKRFFMYGWFWFFLKMLSLLYNKISSLSMHKQLNKNEGRFFKKYEAEYLKIPGEKIHELETVNSTEAIDIIKNNDIDIICFLGGDIARKDFINAAKVCSLNYHSGISPFYNGNKTIFHAVKDYRPNFAGGTLMYITERIDGGGILSHYLPAINESDSAASIFMKGIQGAVELYTHFLANIQSQALPSGVIQKRSFKYVRNIDWTIVDDIKLSVFEKSNQIRIYQRDEQTIAYYDLKSEDINEVYKRALNEILKKNK